MRWMVLAGAAWVVPVFVAAQTGPPEGFAEYELERSRTCVGAIADLAELNRSLAPIAARYERLTWVAEIVALERAHLLDSLNLNDPVQAAVHDWLSADIELARRYISEGDESIVEQRAAATREIMELVDSAGREVDGRIQQRLAESSDVIEAVEPCEGAILVRSAVLEACETESGPVCEAVRAEDPRGYRFVEEAEHLWDVSELRPWSSPSSLRVRPDGSVAGSTTTARTRFGNVVVLVALSPLIQERAEMDAEQVTFFEDYQDSLGIEFDHPRFTFGPTLELRANLPQAIGGEHVYTLHFGEGEAADMIWTGQANSGEVVEANIVLRPELLRRLQAGEPVSFTALRRDPEGGNEPVFSVGITEVNQAGATSAAMDYMRSQLSVDLRRLIPPESG